MLLGARVLLLCSQGRQSNRFHPQDLDLDFYGPMFTPLNVKASFTCEIERKEHFWKVLMNILNIIYFPRLSFSKCNFPSSR